MTIDKDTLSQEALDLLQQLIAIPSLSEEEDKTGDTMKLFCTNMEW